jgi:outer membrane protein OmpA-like peptidoglycan-associated protein
LPHGPPGAALLGAALLAPLAAPAQERATGAVEMERQPPAPRGPELVGPDGRVIPLPPGSAVSVHGANVMVQETPKGIRLTVQNDVLFAFDRAELRPEAEQALRRVAEIIHQRNPRAVEIIGYTDSIGSEPYNQALSRRRAESVEQWLQANGGPLPPLQVDGRGEADPVAPNTVDGRDNPEGRQQNRRVEVLLQR